MALFRKIKNAGFEEHPGDKPSRVDCQSKTKVNNFAHTTLFAVSTPWALPPKPANYEIILVEKIIGLSSLLSIHKLKTRSIH